MGSDIGNKGPLQGRLIKVNESMHQSTCILSVNSLGLLCGRHAGCVIRSPAADTLRSSLSYELVRALTHGSQGQFGGFRFPRFCVT